VLKQRKIRLSHQRMKILEYMCQNRNHPTADQIYTALHDEEPTLSKTTVYNTLHMLTKRGLIRELSIENSEARFDIATADHGHFMCTQCGDIIDFGLDFELLTAADLSGCEVSDKNVYFKGVCSKCLKKAGGK
ncbi:MAG TPA: Fur family transcriptional regulator, partial [Terriglobales bacterium]|nr:Fur family transcriptional regulator [Terriglobales bacterium]